MFMFKAVITMKLCFQNNLKHNFKDFSNQIMDVIVHDNMDHAHDEVANDVHGQDVRDLVVPHDLPNAIGDQD